MKGKEQEAAFLDERGKRAHCNDCKIPGVAWHVRKSHSAIASISTTFCTHARVAGAKRL